MAKIDSTVEQLIHAYKKHYKNSKVEKEDISHQLLLFYAVECALKAKFLKDNRQKSTACFEAMGMAQHGYSHDIAALQKLLKLPEFGYKDTPHTPIKHMHQKLRYGLFGSTQPEKEQVKFLKELAAHLKNEI